MFEPPWTPPDQLVDALKRDGEAVLAPGALGTLGVSAAELDGLKHCWDDLPPDGYLRDGGRYRFRRHGCFVADGGTLTPSPHRAHWQPLDYNALHGGIQRWYVPLAQQMADSPAWAALLLGLARIASELKGEQPWFIEAHPFRIDTSDGIGRPTPEGAHRDGVDFVAVLLVGRHDIKGGESRVFEADGPAGQRFTMTQPWTLLLLDDARVIHETTPIQPLAAGARGWRDTLVITLRSGGFQGP
ncbi:2OG-Fe dioxygenase family protein [Roseateles sp.]|uniref:2OG-Fe dioxygenase family protein n=1 Tax=Roseateles sp. TaxID=1971397 RepID=UPI0025FB6D87|nr:2OG-Fe dioxygenase family protein [Roseateles sp.]MBV8037568.1 2OG-Fe dioxygenase family protein [Roseateles sp.]